jgi:HSP20 family protein
MASTLARWDPFAELAELRARFDRMLGDLGDGHGREWTPAIDVVRNEQELVVRAEVPGIKPEEIKIEADNGVLRISGRHEETKEDKQANYVRRERRVGSFERRMPLPEGVDPNQITATTHEGVLEIKAPLPKEAAKEPVTITPTAGE